MLVGLDSTVLNLCSRSSRAEVQASSFESIELLQESVFLILYDFLASTAHKVFDVSSTL